jgi:hypothetical protein
MKRWLERGGGVVVLAVVIFFSFCVFARVHFGEDTGVKIPLMGFIDLLTLETYAADGEDADDLILDEPPEESYPEVPQPEVPQPEEPQPEVPYSEVPPPDPPEEPPEEEPLPDDEEPREYEPFVYEGPEPESEARTEYELVASIEYNLRVIAGGVVLAICSIFIWFTILKPLKRCIFF